MSNKLRSIVDFQRPFAMFYSGVGYKIYLDIVYKMGVRNFLMSYEYAGGKGASLIKEYKDMGVRFFIDSGVFTYLNDEKYREYSIEQWESHIESYLSWCKKHKHIIFAIANLDLENLLGVEQIEVWNRKYFEPFMLETGIPVCFIWHPCAGEKYWEKMCQRYPYVGFSWVSDEGADLGEDFGMKMLRTAEKYKSVVHGMGMTRTSLLPRLPFYSVDSTSWKVGLRYGLLSIWNGLKVQQFKKEDWDKKALKYIQGYKDIRLDYEKLKQDDMEETIKANVYAYIKAEAYAVERLKPKMYWQKSDINKTSFLEDIEFPSLDWCRGTTNFADYKKYAKNMNINAEYEDDSWVIGQIMYATVFLNLGKKEFENYFEELIKEDLSVLHDEFINQVVGNDDERIQDLIKFYTECVLGKNEKLLMYGTNFDRSVKEREKYIEEDTHEVVEVSKEDIRIKLKGLLPTPEENKPAPEIDDLDDEIFRQIDIIPIRDNKGKFLKGQNQIYKPKNILSDKFPKLACDTCHASARCTEYKSGHACAYHKIFKRFDTRNMTDLIEAMQGMVGLNLERMQRVALFELLGTGLPDPVLSGMINQNMALVDSLRRLYEFGGEEVLRHTKVVRSDGTMEESTQIRNPQSGGILEKLFMNKSSDRDNLEDTPIPTEISNELKDTD